MPPKRPSWRRNALASSQGLPLTWRPRVHGVYMAEHSCRASSSTWADVASQELAKLLEDQESQTEIFHFHADQVDACEVISVGCHTMLDMIEEWSLALPEHLRREKLGQEIDKLKQDATMLIAKGEDVLQYGCVLDTANLCSLCVAQYERLKDNYTGLKHECQPFLSSARKRARNAD